MRYSGANIVQFFSVDTLVARDEEKRTVLMSDEDGKKGLLLLANGLNEQSSVLEILGGIR